MPRVVPTSRPSATAVTEIAIMSVFFRACQISGDSKSRRYQTSEKPCQRLEKRAGLNELATRMRTGR